MIILIIIVNCNNSKLKQHNANPGQWNLKFTLKLAKLKQKNAVGKRWSTAFK